MILDTTSTTQSDQGEGASLLRGGDGGPSVPKQKMGNDDLEQASVKEWLGKIKEAKVYFAEDFNRIRDDMTFAAGFQRKGQTKLETDEYLCNLVIRNINQKVATLYATDPKAIAVPRRRKYYQLWDEDLQSLQPAFQAVQQTQQTGQMPDPQTMALIADFNQGQEYKKMVKKVGDTLEIAYQYICDTQQPSFKLQMKQLVRRTVTTGVGYIRLNFKRTNESILTESGMDDTQEAMAKRVESLVAQIEEKGPDTSDPIYEQLQVLIDSIKAQQTIEPDNVQETIEIDFPSSTSIIVDPRCQALKGFIGAQWIAQEFILPISDVNAFFELSGDAAIQAGQVVAYDDCGNAVKEPKLQAQQEASKEDPLCCLYEIFDYTSKSSLFVCEGYKDYVQEPQPVAPALRGFWPVFTLTFNDIEIERGQKATIYPPSDVSLMKSAQKEWNRSREALRNQRIANAPKYFARDGVLTSDDRKNLSDCEPSEIIFLKGVPPDGDVNKAIVPFKQHPIDPAVYDVSQYEQDILLSVGAQQANVGPAQAHVTATNSSIAEQSRMSGTSSNADDLDDLLSAIAQASGELMLNEFSPQTITTIVGPGAVWPQQDKESFVNELYLKVVAASSGRPNKAVDVANAERLIPLAINAGANSIGVIQYLVKILDDRLDLTQFITPGMGQPQDKGGGARDYVNINFKDTPPDTQQQILQSIGLPPSKVIQQTGQNPSIAPAGPKAGAQAHAQISNAMTGGSQSVPVQKN